MMKSFTMGALFALVNAVEIEREPLLSWAPTKCWPPQSSPCEKDIKRDYFVTNFGGDKDIEFTQKHIKDAETRLNTKWVPTKKGKPAQVTDYSVPNLGMDRDVKDTAGSIQSTEAKLGAWNPKADKDGAFIVPTPYDNASYSY